MPLPILQTHHTATRDDLIRFYHRTELHWSRHLGEETTLDVGVAIVNPEQAPEANRMLELTLPLDMTPQQAMQQIDEHFKSNNTRCASFVFTPGLENQNAPLLDYFTQHAFTPRATDIMYLAGQPSRRIDEVPGLTIIPARASFKHFRALAEEGSLEWGRLRNTEAAMLHLDDSHVDALLALRDGVPVASACVLAVGEIGCVETLYVSKSFRRQGIGRTMMSRALEICARSLFKHVFLTRDPADPTASNLYTHLGFKKIGQWTEYHAPDSPQAGV